MGPERWIIPLLMFGGFLFIGVVAAQVSPAFGAVAMIAIVVMFLYGVSTGDEDGDGTPGGASGGH